MNSRQQNIGESLEVIGIERFTNFIQSEATRADGVTAIALLNRALEAGEDIEATLLSSNGWFDDSGNYGFNLTVTPIGMNRFGIALGCLAGPLAGDGGEWEVAFDELGQIVEISGGLAWES